MDRHPDPTRFPESWWPPHLFERGTTLHRQHPPARDPGSPMQRLTALSEPLLNSPYLNPTDAGRIVRENAFLRGLLAALLAGWIVSYGIAIAAFGIPAPIKSAWAAVASPEASQDTTQP
jgi:hypothetical protein